MIGKWKVTSQHFWDEKVYQVYRLRDVNAVDHSGNREYAGGTTDNRTDAEALAAELNGVGEEKR